MRKNFDEVNSFANRVRPDVATPRPFAAKALNCVRMLAGGDRFLNLYRAISDMVAALKIENIRLLDFGCGTMDFSSRLRKDGMISDFVGMDIYQKPADSDDPKWGRYVKIDYESLDMIGGGGFDVAMLIDVLHHINEEDQAATLRVLAKSSRYILVKDHFEYGQISRQLLRLADWFGNWAYGVSIPKRYFNQERWDRLVESAGLTQVALTKNVRVHDGIFGVIVGPQHQFLSVLTVNL